MLTRRSLLGLFAGTAATLACRRSAWPDASRHQRAVLAAIDRAGLRVRRGDRVVIKVNTNSGDPYPYSSSPIAVAAITRRLVAAGATVTVGDRSFWGDRDTAGNLEANGIAAAAREAGARVVVFDDDIDWVDIDPARVPHWKPPLRLPRIAVEADCLINLACMKTHFIAGATLGLKNWLGLVHADDRARPGNLRSHDRDLIHHQIIDVHRALAPHLTVIDGFRALVGGGPLPTNGTVAFADPEIVLAGRDRIALDIAALGILQQYAHAREAIHATSPEHHPTIAAARAGRIE